MEIHIGIMGWSYDFWIGNFYPESAENLLIEYAKNFDTVEIDNTFYRIPSMDTVKNWKEEVPENFIFTAKFPRKITHIKMLEDYKEELEVFIEHMLLLGNKLGPMLIQLPPSFKPEKFEILKDFLASLPKRRFALEVRNKKWLDEKLYNLLRDNGIALALIDHPWMPPMSTITADFTYIRWEGDRNKIKGTLGKVERDRSNDIKDWGMTIKGFLEDSVEVFGYFSKFYSGFPPSDVRMLLDTLRKDDYH